MSSTKQSGLQPIRNALTTLAAAFACNDETYAEMTQFCIIIPLLSGAGGDNLANRGIKIWQRGAHMYVAPCAHGNAITVGNYLAAGTRVKSVPQLNTALRAIRELICGVDPATRAYASERSSVDRTPSNKYKIPRFGIIQPPLTNIRDTPIVQPPPGLASSAKK